MHKMTTFKILFVAALLAAVFAGCSKNDYDDGVQSYQPDSESVYEAKDTTTNYCLACHEQTYERFAKKTAEDLKVEDYWLNPHRSAHGSGISCLSCHEPIKEGEITACTDLQYKVKRSDVCTEACHADYSDHINVYPDYY